MKTLVIIPARGGSKGVSRKNIREVAGKPLIAWSIEAALGSRVVDKLVVSTDDSEIAQVARKHGADVIERPAGLSGDAVLTEPVMLHALEQVESEGFHPGHVSLLQCTSPFITAGVIRDAVNKVSEGKFDSCITVFMPDGFEFKWRGGENRQFMPDHDVSDRPRRQDMDLPFHENGAFYITRTDLFKKTQNRFGGKEARVTAVEMSEADSLQIDSEYHLWLADELMRKKQKN